MQVYYETFLLLRANLNFFIPLILRQDKSKHVIPVNPVSPKLSASHFFLFDVPHICRAAVLLLASMFGHKDTKIKRASAIQYDKKH
jgi:hypothetical protein